MSNPTERTQELSKSALDISRRVSGASALLRCVDTSVLRGSSGKEIRLRYDELTVGRGKDNSVVINGVGVSRRHARIFFADDRWHVEDLGSTNGTRVNNSNIRTAALNDGDTLAFGRVCYKFMRLDDPSRTSSRALDLGLDRTLVMQPDELPAGGPGEELPPAAARAAARKPAPRTSARKAGDTTARGRSLRLQSEERSPLVTWLFIVLAILLAGLAVLVFMA